MLRISLIFQAFFILFVPFSNAQTRTIGLNEALLMATKASKQVKLSELQVALFDVKVAQAKDRGIPNLGVNGSYNRLGQPDVSLSSSVRNLLGNRSGAEPQMEQRATPKVNEAILAQASLSAPVFAGLKNRYSIRAERLLEQAAVQNALKVKDDAMLSALINYYTLYKLQASIEILRQDVSEQQRRTNDLSNLEKNGLFTRNDLLRSQVQLSNLRLSFIDASTTYESAYFNFKIMLGIPVTDSIRIDTNALFLVHALGKKEEYFVEAVNRPDFKAFTLQDQAAKLAAKQVKSAYYPSIALTGGYVNAWVPGLATIRNVLSASVGVRYNLSGLYTTKHLLQESELNNRTLIAQREQLDDAVKIAVNQSYLTYEEALKRIAVTELTISQASENYRILNNKYKNSLATLTDLLDGEVSLLTARLNRTEAKADAEIAWFRLQNAAGRSFNSTSK